MKSKLLFILAIVVAHGAVGAGLIHDLSSPSREMALTCVNTPSADPYFAPPRELFAATVVTSGVGDEMQP
jgi:hypothetical protein